MNWKKTSYYQFEANDRTTRKNNSVVITLKKKFCVNGEVVLLESSDGTLSKPISQWLIITIQDDD